jgi:hypothetical protein
MTIDLNLAAAGIIHGPDGATVNSHGLLALGTLNHGSTARSITRA